MVLHKHGERLYTGVKKVVADHLTKKVNIGSINITTRHSQERLIFNRSRPVHFRKLY